MMVMSQKKKVPPNIIAIGEAPAEPALLTAASIT